MSCEGCRFWSSRVTVRHDGSPDTHLCLLPSPDGIPLPGWDQRMTYLGCKHREEGPAVDEVKSDIIYTGKSDFWRANDETLWAKLPSSPTLGIVTAEQLAAGEPLAVITVAQLRSIEWACDDLPICPACGNCPAGPALDCNGHSDDCWLAKALHE